MKKTKKVRSKPYPKPAEGSKRTAAVSELKAGLSAYLARVKAGEVVVVTDRGTPVAKLVPIPREEDPEMQRLRRLEAQGLIRFPTAKLPPDFWELPRPTDPEGLVRKALLEERESGW
ncbi:MAG TPA: type II toxin-antitoxin system prevent-host-death family antitoxin [Gemmatimonadales bacterium]|nr:type II toxin-antitoxin system prevent-host-death family antitoxin [Gemmatimonadales bacterium]